MHRRAVLKSVFSTFAGAELLLSVRATSAPPSERQTPSSKTKGPPTSFLTTSDGTALFYRDWGTGSPLVFLAPWGLHSN
jgi:non-heme chloroperoxidase